MLAQILPSPYAKWLNEDVVYVIDNEEYTAFLKLTTDEERDKFIEQFWLRRDPTPDTQRNEFKEEHYRRISYANEHFASARRGWQTDRGHVYIVYGPPDEIESHRRKRDGVHSSGPPPRFASEVWLYRHIDGVGEHVKVTFIDRTGAGDWCLAPGPGSEGVVLRRCPVQGLLWPQGEFRPEQAVASGSTTSPTAEAP